MNLFKIIQMTLIAVVILSGRASAGNLGKATKKKVLEACEVMDQLAKAGSMQGIKMPEAAITKVASCCSAITNGCSTAKSTAFSFAGAGATVTCAVGTVGSAIGTGCCALGETFSNVATYCSGRGWQGYAGTSAGARCTQLCFTGGRIAAGFTVNNICSAANSAAEGIFDAGQCIGITEEQAGAAINWAIDTLAKMKSGRR